MDYLWTKYTRMIIILAILMFVSGLPVVQQPVGDGMWLPDTDTEIAQLQSPTIFNVIGLAAHNYTSAGKFIRSLDIGDVISLRYDNREEYLYKIVEIDLYTYDYPYANIYYDGAGKEYTRSDLYMKHYARGELTLQTCEITDKLGFRFVRGSKISQAFYQLFMSFIVR